MFFSSERKAPQIHCWCVMIRLSCHLGNKDSGPDDERDPELENLHAGGSSGEIQRHLSFLAQEWGLGCGGSRRVFSEAGSAPAEFKLKGSKG